MKPLRALPILILLALLSQAADAAVRRFCLVAYQTNRGWSEEFRVEVTFLTGQELNQATRTFEYGLFDKYALIWFEKDEVAILKIEDIMVGVGSEFTATDFQRQFLIISEKEATQVNSRSNRKWKINAKSGVQWVDPRVQ